ncbi:MAG: outer membrane protein assembly factor BamD [candidate division WOR-3 bacterium]
MKKIFLIFFTIFFACLFKKAKPTDLDPERYFELGLYNFYKGKYDKARFYFNRVLFSGEIKEYTDDAQFYIAKSYLNEKQFETAISEYNFLINQFPNSEHIEEAEFDLIKLEILKVRSPLHETKELEKVLAKLSEFQKKYPESQYIEEIKALKGEVLNILAEKIYKIAELYENMKKFNSAKIYYEELINKYPDTIWAEKAREKINKK